MKFIRHILNNAPMYLLGSLATVLFSYHVDYSTLGSWDEAWYGSIAREMVRSGDWLRMNWNGKPFADHPPMGMWLMAISYSIFGISELTTRLPSVLAGIGTTVLMYRVGVLLSGSRIFAMIAALILNTSVWYVIRVRSGNLDAVFVFFYITTVYLSLKSSKNIKWFPLVGIATACLLLTKTLVGASVLPLIVLLNWQHIFRLRESALWLIGGVICFVALLTPWYYINWHWYPDFYTHHFITIGTRGKTADSYFQLQYEQPLFYLHMGVRKWYWLWVAAVTYLLATFRFVKPYIAFVLVWNALVLYPFLTTDQTHIWHLIPVYIPLSFVISLAAQEGVNMGMRIFFLIEKRWRKNMKAHIVRGLAAGCLFSGILFISILQGRIFYSEVFPQNRYVSDDVAISKLARNYEQTIYLDDDYLPLAVFYSGAFMRQMAYEPDERKTLVNLFRSGEKDFVVITRNWALNNLKENGLTYRVLEQNSSFSIVTKPDH